HRRDLSVGGAGGSRDHRGPKVRADQPFCRRTAARVEGRPHVWSQAIQDLHRRRGGGRFHRMPQLGQEQTGVPSRPTDQEQGATPRNRTGHSKCVLVEVLRSVTGD
ncbi:uncharacterized protein LOC134783335, partial [Penaeus indicus]|uniref:uncharacterized protein LOC134783335 n=1 Tax=Penaeus indicus TaxID=29960 RepID=UPI00300CBA37